MPEVSKQALEFLDVMVSEGFNYPLESASGAGMLGRELLDAGYVLFGTRGKPLQICKSLFMGGISPNLFYDYSLEPTAEGRDYLSEHRTELFSDISCSAFKLLAEMVCNEETPLFENGKTWLPGSELLGAGYAETFDKVVVDFSPIMDFASAYELEPIINLPIFITVPFLRPTREGAVYLTKNMDELFELYAQCNPEPEKRKNS